MTNNLNFNDILIYKRIKFFVDEKLGFCYESNQELAKLIQREKISAQRSIKKLLILGYIKNDGTRTQRRLITTDKKPPEHIIKSDIRYIKSDTVENKSDYVTISDLLPVSIKSDMFNVSKVICLVNKSDTQVIDSIRLELKKVIDKAIKDYNNRFNKEKENKKFGELESVLLTNEQYESLKGKYRNIDLAIEKLDTWLNTSDKGRKCKGINHYGYFKSNSWVWDNISNENPQERFIPKDGVA